MSLVDMGITAPCPFCGNRDAPEVEQDGGEVYAYCEDCLGRGPPTRVGCRDEEEDGPFDLEREALELWNDRGMPEDADITVKQIESMIPELEASLIASEMEDPEVREARRSYDAAVQKILERKKRPGGESRN